MGGGGCGGEGEEAGCFVADALVCAGDEDGLLVLRLLLRSGGGGVRRGLGRHGED